MSKSVRHVVYVGILFALAITLSWAESLIPPLPFLPPGVKLGLSNVVTMYCLFCIGWREAFLIALLKGAFAFVTRGATAGLLSGAGGILSVLSLLLCIRLFKQRISYTALSVIGAVCHNLGQLFMASLLVDTPPISVLSPHSFALRYPHGGYNRAAAADRSSLFAEHIP